MSEQVVERLDRLIAIVSPTFASQIEAARERVRARPVSACTLEYASDWTGGRTSEPRGDATGMSSRSVRTKLAELVNLGAAEMQGKGPTTAYETTGLI